MPRQVPPPHWHRGSDTPTGLAAFRGFRLWLCKAAVALHRANGRPRSRSLGPTRQPTAGQQRTSGGSRRRESFSRCLGSLRRRPLAFSHRYRLPQRVRSCRRVHRPPARFDREFERVVQWAAGNRATIHEEIAHVFGQTELVLDLPTTRMSRFRMAG